MEYTIPPWAAGKLSNPFGKPMNYVEAVRFIETVYGITIADLYDRKTKILNRCKITAFIDEMRRVLAGRGEKIDQVNQWVSNYFGRPLFRGLLFVSAQLRNLAQTKGNKKAARKPLKSRP